MPSRVVLLNLCQRGKKLCALVVVERQFLRAGYQQLER